MTVSAAIRLPLYGDGWGMWQDPAGELEQVVAQTLAAPVAAGRSPRAADRR